LFDKKPTEPLFFPGLFCKKCLAKAICGQYFTANQSLAINLSHASEVGSCAQMSVQMCIFGQKKVRKFVQSTA
jgi:hypothetical protein